MRHDCQSNINVEQVKSLANDSIFFLVRFLGTFCKTKHHWALPYQPWKGETRVVKVEIGLMIRLHIYSADVSYWKHSDYTRPLRHGFIIGLVVGRIFNRKRGDFFQMKAYDTMISYFWCLKEKWFLSNESMG